MTKMKAFTDIQYSTAYQAISGSDVKESKHISESKSALFQAVLMGQNTHFLPLPLGSAGALLYR